MLSPTRPNSKHSKDPEDRDAERRPPRVILLREIKGDSAVHRLWAGTKLVSVAGLSVVLSYYPSWGALGLTTALLLSAGLVARIPGGALPRPPRWFWITIAVTGALASIAGGSPHVTIAGARLGLGGIDAYCRFVSVGIVLLLAAAMVGWTTPLGEIAPAVARLMWPLRLVKVPVDEASVAVALCVRSLPLLVGEMRILIAARRLRPPPKARPGRSNIERWLDELIDLLVAALAVSVRRAGELAEAITARGGTGLIAAKTRSPKLADGVTIALVAAVCVGAALIPG
ncbi:MAG TPA: energy-coupling factor transporter transmembrane protein EcfT [Acidimicrobiales bacterium]|nr:energy-coupling factor transporter transmembrane protein EcfT [Acidimicrobiales bacterium]